MNAPAPATDRGLDGTPSIILACDYSLGYLGGAQIAFMRQALALAGLGWRVIVVAPGAQRAFGGEAIPNLVIREPRVRLTLPGLDLPVLPRRKLARALVKLGREHDAGGIVVHSEFSLAAAALEAGERLGVPVLHTVHTFFWRAPVAASIAAPAVTAFHCALTGLPRLPRCTGGTPIDNALRSMTLRVALRADGVLSPSRHQARALRIAGVENVQALSNVSQPMSVGDAGPAAEPAAPAVEPAAEPSGEPAAVPAADVRGRPLELVWAGRFAPEKRLEVALDAVARANRSIPGAVRLHVAGGEHAPVDGVEFHGRLTSDEVGVLIARADAALLTSVGFDNQPMIALEAFARGKPLVATDPVLLEEFGAAAIGADDPGSASLAAALVALAGDPSALAAASAEARRYAEARQPEQHAAQLLEALRAASPK